MSTATLHSEPGLKVSCVPTREPRISILRLDISTVIEDLDPAMEAVRTFFDTCSGRIVTHAHISSDETPGMAQVMSLVRHVMELQTVMDTKLKGTIVQMGRHDKRVDWSLALMNTVYKPTSEQAARRVFEVVDTDEGAERVLEGILAHEAEKQARWRRTRKCV
tara:strand:+ start:29 stop:517 length:489 start_codon:yes stop_codon:yes gene_type:complete